MHDEAKAATTQLTGAFSVDGMAGKCCVSDYWLGLTVRWEIQDHPLWGLNHDAIYELTEEWE